MLVAGVLAGALGMVPPEPDALRLAWQAPQACPTEAQVRAGVDALLEQAPLRPLSAQGEITRHGDTWRLVLRFRDTTKELEASSCEALGDAAAVILSLALSPDQVQPEPQPDPEPAPDPKPAPELEPADAPRPDAPPNTTPEAPPAAPGTRALARFDLGLGFGVTPTLTAARFAVGASGRWGRAEVSGALWTPADAADARGAGYRLLVTMGFVAARGCLTPGRGVVTFPLCVGAGLGALRTADRSPSGRQVRHAAWPAATGSAGLTWFFRPSLALGASAEAHVGLRSLSVALQDSERSFQPGPAAIRGTVGIEVHFPSRTLGSAGKRRR